MTRKAIFFFILSPVLIGATFIALETGADDPVPADEQMLAHAELIAEVRRRIRLNHVGDVSEEQLLEGALRGMVTELEDPFSAYLDPEAYKAMTADNQGQFGGLGVTISIEDRVLTVITPITGTPAYKAGLKPGDKVIAIEGKSTEGFSTLDAVRVLRGEPGTKVTITILREGREPFDVTIERAIIKVQSVKWARMLEGTKVGYVYLAQFQEGSTKELAEAIEQLKGKGAEALVLDLRFNGGGLLTESISIVDLFIDEGVIVKTKGRIEQMNNEAVAKKDATVARDLPLAVLINGGSASASEIVSGALQDHRRALVIGDRSYGKGSVQSIYTLRDQRRALKITTAYYYTPSGRNISRTKTSRGGIEPDVPVSLSDDELRSLAERRRQLDILAAGGEVEKLSADKQLEAALQAIAGKRVQTKLAK